jgi:hypothetical protein
VLLQGLDTRGVPRVAELAAVADDRGLHLVRAETLAGTAAVLTVLPAGGSPAAATPADGRADDTAAGGGPELRLLPPPDRGLVGGGVYLRDGALPRQAEFRRLLVGADGLTEPLDPLDAAEQVYVVAVQGRPAADARVPLRVLGSGMVGPSRLTPAPWVVQLASPTLQFGNQGPPSYGWYADARLLAGRLGGPVIVAALSAPGAVRLDTGRGRGRVLYARGYEVVRATTRWLAYLVWLDDRPLCIDLTRLGPVARTPRLTLAVQRCMSRRYGAGLVQVFAGPKVASLRLSLAPGRSGERAYRATLRTGQDQAQAVPGYSRVIPIPVRYPTGPAGAAALDGAGRTITRVDLGRYPR